MRLSILAAMSPDRVIGLDNRLPWKLPADLARFKQLTMGHYLLMGRKTFDSIGKPLPGRVSVVVTRQKTFQHDGVLVAHSLEEALEHVRFEVEVFVAGGAQIYELTLPLASHLYLTIVDGEFEGDTHFPEFDQNQWKLTAEESHEADELNRWAYVFKTYQRIRAS